MLPIILYVDADACPVKNEVYKVAERYGLKVYVVANSYINVPRDPMIERVVVATDMDAADDWIAEHVDASSIVVTSDIPLASRSVKAGASAIAPNGRIFTADSVGMQLATRNLMQGLRDAGQTTSGPASFTPRDRSKFLSSLDAEIVRLKRRA